MPTSRLVPGRYPPPEASPIADRIRERRGVRGLTPLDGTLLHIPAVADGWNSLLGAIRTEGEFPVDVRELMILRVAARNHAAFEWIHHEDVGRSYGLTTQQLRLIRDVHHKIIPAIPVSGTLSALQAAALEFADASTVDIKVRPEMTERLVQELSVLDIVQHSEKKEDKVQDLLVEAAAVVATYNMVSRFLVSLDIAGMTDDPVPWPADRQEHSIPFLSHPYHSLHVVTLTTHSDAPWIVLSNSLITDHTLWEPLLPYLLEPRAIESGLDREGKPNTYNVVLFDQRGHGTSSLPPPPLVSSSPSSPIYPSVREVTIPLLAHDIAHILSFLHIPRVHAVIGVSQGGAAALAFGAMYPTRVEKVVSCDTSPRTAPGNREAWEERIILGKGTTVKHGNGLKTLAKITSERWFPIPSDWSRDGTEGIRVWRKERARERASAMIERTSIDGFEAGARALQDYDLINPPPSSPGSFEGQQENSMPSGLLQCKVPTLLVAGSLDGGGNVPSGMKKLAEEWNAVQKVDTAAGVKEIVQFVSVDGAGHLPMIDETQRFWEVVQPFLDA